MWQSLLGWVGVRAKFVERSRRTRIGRNRKARRGFFEPLEQRKMLASVPIPWPDLSGSDQIVVDASGSNLLITVNSLSLAPISVAGYDTVLIEGGDGNDQILVNGLPSASDASPGPILERTEPNDAFTPTGSQNVDNAGWSMDFDVDIGDENGSAISATVPHVTILGSGDDTFDIYSFTVAASPVTTAAIFDIDFTMPDALGLDFTVEIFSDTDFVTPLNMDPDTNLLVGDDGPITSGGNGSTNFLDPFVPHVFDSSATDRTYYLRVGTFGGQGIPSGASYALHILLPNHPLSGGAAPSVIVNGGSGSDTLVVDASLMPLSAVDQNVLQVGPLPFEGTLSHGTAEVLKYQSVETFNGGAAYTVQANLAQLLGTPDGIADTTFVRPSQDGTKLLLDVNGVNYFTGGIGNILILEVNGSADDDAILVQNTIIGAHVSGGDGNDTITTAAGPDIVYGGGGNDTISTNGGDDYVAGGEGNDTISGGDGNDSLHGNGGDDILAGEGGHDIVTGGAGNDQVSGQQGQDVLIGGSGADQVLGNKDRDLLFAAGVVIQENGSPVSLGESDSNEFGDLNYGRLQTLRQDWLRVVALCMTFAEFDLKYDSTADDGAADKLQGGQGDDVFFTDGSATIVDTPFDQEVST